MGLKSVGSNPTSPNIINNKINNYVITKLNLNLSKNTINNYFFFSKNNFYFIKMLYSLGCIFRYKIVFLKGKKFIKVNIFYYKYKPFYKNIKLISTPSKIFYITKKALNILTKSINSSTLIISTNKGILSHNLAIKKNTGGIVLCILS